MFSMNFPLRLALVSMCMLSFESCALVRQRHQKTSVTAAISESHATIGSSFTFDTCAEQLQIVLDSIEFIRYDTLVNDIPSPAVKVRVTKATINRQATEAVTRKELNQTSDTTAFSAFSEQSMKEGCSTPPSPRPPIWASIMAIAFLSLLLWAYIRK